MMNPYEYANTLVSSWPKLRRHVQRKIDEYQMVVLGK